jgi:hypothetical protein
MQTRSLASIIHWQVVRISESQIKHVAPIISMSFDEQSNLHQRHPSGGRDGVSPQSGGPAVFNPAAMMASAMAGGVGGGGNPLQNAVMGNIAEGMFSAAKENVSNPGLLVKYIPGTYGHVCAHACTCSLLC